MGLLLLVAAIGDGSTSDTPNPTNVIGNGTETGNRAESDPGPDRVGREIRPGSRDGSWTTESWTDQGIRDEVGASHIPVAELFDTVLDAGFELRHVSGGGEPPPSTLSSRACRAHPADSSEH